MDSSAYKNFLLPKVSPGTPGRVQGRKIFISGALLIIFFALGFFLISRSSKNFLPSEIQYVKVGGVDVKVDLALTALEQTRGLAGRTEFPEKSGMLFVFDRPGEYYFWMQGMNFPIDIIWIGEGMQVIYIKKNAGLENPLQTYGPKQNSKYVLEVVSGFSDKYGLKEGDKVEFTF